MVNDPGEGLRLATSGIPPTYSVPGKIENRLTLPLSQYFGVHGAGLAGRIRFGILCFSKDVE